MSVREVVAPVYQVACEGANGEYCPARFMPPTKSAQRSPYAARLAAEDAGWDVRPSHGRGSRSAPDRCPECKQARGRT